MTFHPSAFQVLASIGDADEEEEASAAAGIPFVQVDVCRPEVAWAELETLLGSVFGVSEQGRV